MTNVKGAEFIKNAFVELLKNKGGISDTQKTDELTTKYLSDNIINENEFQEISAEFGEDFANEAKTLSETTTNGTKKEDVKTWEDAVKYMSEKQGIDVGKLTEGTEPKDCTRTTKTYYYDGGKVVLSRASDHGEYTMVTIEAKDGKSYSYNLNSGHEAVKETPVEDWEDAVANLSNEYGIDVGKLTEGTEPKDCTRTTKTYYYDGGKVVLSRASDHGEYTMVTIEANDNKSYTYNLNTDSKSVSDTPVDNWEDAVANLSNEYGIDVGELKEGTEPKDCTRTTKTYYYDGGKVVLSRASDHGEYTMVTIEANDNKSYTYN